MTWINSKYQRFKVVEMPKKRAGNQATGAPKYAVKEFLLHPMLLWNHRNLEDNRVTTSELCFRKMELGRRKRRRFRGSHTESWETK